MIVVKSTVNTFINLPVLQAAAQAAFGAAYLDCNVTDFGASVSVYLSQAVSGAQTTWDNLVSAQDPVTIQIDKSKCTADGTDFATVSVQAPKPTAAPVTLQVLTPNGVPITQAITLAAGLGSVQIKTLLYGVHTVSVQNGANRNTDVLEFEGV